LFVTPGAEDDDPNNAPCIRHHRHTNNSQWVGVWWLFQGPAVSWPFDLFFETRWGPAVFVVIKNEARSRTHPSTAMDDEKKISTIPVSIALVDEKR
jgi:hypothetical protein